MPVPIFWFFSLRSHSSKQCLSVQWRYAHHSLRNHASDWLCSLITSRVQFFMLPPALKAKASNEVASSRRTHHTSHAASDQNIICLRTADKCVGDDLYSRTKLLKRRSWRKCRRRLHINFPEGNNLQNKGEISGNGISIRHKKKTSPKKIDVRTK